MVAPLNSARAFVELERAAEPYRPPLERLEDWDEIAVSSGGSTEWAEQQRRRQAARCMDCGTPFCQTHSGCPLSNLIPEWNELVLREHWEEALAAL